MMRAFIVTQKPDSHPLNSEKVSILHINEGRSENGALRIANPRQEHEE